MTDVIVFLILAIFCPFTQKLKIEKENMKEMPRDIIILRMCTKNYDQMMYGS